jgi:hypothetical protein
VQFEKLVWDITTVDPTALSAPPNPRLAVFLKYEAEMLTAARK